MDNIKALFRIIGQLSYVLTRKQKKEAISVFLTMIVCSILELLGVSVIYPFLQLMMDETAIKNKWYINWLYSFSPNISFAGVLIALCVGIILVYLIKNGITLLCVYKQNKYAASFQRELSTTMLRAFMKQPYEYFVNTNSAWISQCITGDTLGTYNILLRFFELMAECLTVLLIAIYLLYTDWVVALAALLVALGCFLVIVLAFKKRLKQAGKEQTIASMNSLKSITQAIYGIKEIIVSDRRECFVNAFEKAQRQCERINLVYNFLLACPDRILEGVCIGGFIGIACVRIIMGSNPTEFIPVLGAFAVGAFKILPSISKISNRINGIVFEQTRLARCAEDLRITRKLEEKRDRKILKEDVEGAETTKLIFKQEIHLKSVTWKYLNAPNPVLSDLELVIHKGEAVALIGASGAGKTTLADIILGLFAPHNGAVYMDGIDISTIPHTWARTVGYVPQMVYLIDDTIKANIAFGIPDEQVDDERIWQVIIEAQLDSFVKSLPEGINTIVGERGVKFSGGQRQRVAIARALYNNPEVLVLDEATSALDTETESAVMESIEALLGRKTMIIIAHRLTTIRNCDKIYEVVNGKAIERDKKSVI